MLRISSSQLKNINSKVFKNLLPALALVVETVTKGVDIGGPGVVQFVMLQCVKDCGLHNLNIDMIISFACLIGWLDSSPVEIQIKLRHDLQKPGWAGVNIGMAPWMALITTHAIACAIARAIAGPQSLAHYDSYRRPSSV